MKNDEKWNPLLSRCIKLLKHENFSSPFNFVKVLICHFSVLRLKRVRVCRWEWNLSFLEQKQNYTAVMMEAVEEGEWDPTQPWKVCASTEIHKILAAKMMHILT